MRRGNISNNSQIKMFNILFFYKIFHLEFKKNPIGQKKKTKNFQIKLLPSINPRFSIKELQSLLTLTIQGVKYCLVKLTVAKVDPKICWTL